MNGRTYPADHPVWNTWYPPNGFRCRCRVDALREKDVDQDDIEQAMPSVEPDEGFMTNPSEWLD